jgi:hypothetical protein
VRQDRFEREVERLLEKVTLDEQLVELVLAELGNWLNGGDREGRVAQPTQAEAIREGERSIERLLDLLLRGVVDEDAYRAKRRELETDLAKLRKEARAIEAQSRAARTTVENGLHFASVALRLFRGSGPAIRRRIVDALGIECLIDAGEIEIRLHPLFEKIVRFKEGHIELFETGFWTAKKGHSRAPVFVGWPETLVDELLQVAEASKPISCRFEATPEDDQHTSI